MSSIIRSLNYTILHTDGTDVTDDVSFQKAAWPMEKRRTNLRNAYRICEEADIDAEGHLAVIGFDQANKDVRIVDEPDVDLFTKVPGNTLVTSKRGLVLEGWASDCCLVALIADDGEQAAVLHASVNTFHNGVIERSIMALRNHGARHITAFVGACAGVCCYEYGADKAKEDFAGFESFVRPAEADGKVYLDLYGAVCAALQNMGAEVVDLYSQKCRCSICAKSRDGRFMFPSFRRDVDAEGRHMNGQYGLFVVLT